MKIILDHERGPEPTGWEDKRMEAMDGNLWKILRVVYWILAAVVAVYVAAGISTVQEELTGVRPEELTNKIYSRLVYGRSHQLERRLEAMKEAPSELGEFWGKEMPPEDPFDWERLYRELG
jgi:hypothetical protein